MSDYLAWELLFIRCSKVMVLLKRLFYKEYIFELRFSLSYRDVEEYYLVARCLAK